MPMEIRKKTANGKELKIMFVDNDSKTDGWLFRLFFIPTRWQENIECRIGYVKRKINKNLTLEDRMRIYSFSLLLRENECVQPDIHNQELSIGFCNL